VWFKQKNKKILSELFKRVELILAGLEVRDYRPQCIGWVYSRERGKSPPLSHTPDFLSASASVSAVTLVHAEYVAVGHGTFKGSEP